MDMNNSVMAAAWGRGVGRGGKGRKGDKWEQKNYNKKGNIFQKGS